MFRIIGYTLALGLPFIVPQELLWGIMLVVLVEDIHKHTKGQDK